MSSGSFPVSCTEVLSFGAADKIQTALGLHPTAGSSQSRARNPQSGRTQDWSRRRRGGPAASPRLHRTRAWVESPRAAPPLPLPRRPSAPGAPPANPGPVGLLPGSARCTRSAASGSAPPPRPASCALPSRARPSPLPLGRPLRPPAPPPPPPRVPGRGGAARQAQPPAPMAARRSQRRRGRRGEPGTALLAPLALGLGLALACLGLLLAAVSLGSRASPPAQVRPLRRSPPGAGGAPSLRSRGRGRVG